MDSGFKVTSTEEIADAVWERQLIAMSYEEFAKADLVLFVRSAPSGKTLSLLPAKKQLVGHLATGSSGS